MSRRLFNGGLNWQIQFSLNVPRTNSNYFFPKNTCIIIILVFLRALDLNIHYKFYWFCSNTHFWWFLAYKTSECKANYTHSSNKPGSFYSFALSYHTSKFSTAELDKLSHTFSPRYLYSLTWATNAHHSNNSSLVLVTRREATKAKRPEWPHVVCSYSLFNISF